MKRIFVSLSLLLAVGLTQVFADDEIRISKTVKESFKKEFAGANKVEWSRVDDHVRALFVLDRHRVVAYFNVAAVFYLTKCRWLQACRLTNILRVPTL